MQLRRLRVQPLPSEGVVRYRGSRHVLRPRAYWKGYLRLSLVSIGVELYAATASADATALHQIHKPSGKRVRYEKSCRGSAR